MRSSWDRPRIISHCPFCGNVLNTHLEGAEPEDMKCVNCLVWFTVAIQPFTRAVKITAPKIVPR